MFKHITFTALMIGSVATALPALAQSICGPRDQVITKLENSFGEIRMGAGLRSNISIFEIWASVDSGTWTMVITDTEGVTCVMASGEYWQDIPAVKAAQGAPA